MSSDLHPNDPRSGVDGDRFTETTDAEVAEAVSAAALISEHEVLADPHERITLLRAAARRLREREAEVVATAALETGLADGRLRGELERTARQLEAFAEVVAAGHYVDAYIDAADPQAQPIARPDLRRMLVPIGPVAVFAASNFPLAFSTAGGDTASALAAGCPVLVKAHPGHPATSELVGGLLAAAVREAELPDGVFSLVQSAGVEIGEHLVTRPELAAVAFTGSLKAGRALFSLAAARPKPIPVYAEMGSVNPLIVTAAALRARGAQIADGLAAAISGSAGQLCTKPGLIFVPAGEEGRALQSRLAERLELAPPHPALNRAIYEGYESAVDALAAAGEVLVPEPGVNPAARQAAGYWPVPHLIRTSAARLAGTPQLREEAFGPAAVLVEYEDPEQLAAAIRSLDGQLTGTVHAESEDYAGLSEILRLLRQRVGRLIFNGYPTGVAVSHAMQHGGPYPATSAPATTSVGMTAIARFLRPVVWQDAPAEILPAELRDENPGRIMRRLDGQPVLPG